MGIWKTFKCTKCGRQFESILDICGRCGGRSVPESGIEACLDSGRPPGYAGGKTTPHSARAYDKCFEENFKILGISNLYHKDGVPIVTRAKKPQLRYNSMPDWAGAQAPIKAYAGPEAMRADGIAMPPMVVDGKPFQLPQVHPTVQPGAKIGSGISAQMRSRTIITYRDNGK